MVVCAVFRVQECVTLTKWWQSAHCVRCAIKNGYEIEWLQDDVTNGWIKVIHCDHSRRGCYYLNNRRAERHTVSEQYGVGRSTITKRHRIEFCTQTGDRKKLLLTYWSIPFSGLIFNSCTRLLIVKRKCNLVAYGRSRNSYSAAEKKDEKKAAWNKNVNDEIEYSAQTKKHHGWVVANGKSYPELGKVIKSNNKKTISLLS